MPFHLAIRVYGRVQGVFFRQFCLREAQNLQLSGFVRNDPDGTVFIEAEGKKADLDAFVSLCHHGPPTAYVKKVQVLPGKLKNYSGFTITG
jgi:acylphosphatase